jgi:transcriptional regulator with XRE-family HTH domain
MKPKRNVLSKLLKHYREKSGYSQADIANLIGVSRSTYASYEEGRRFPTIAQVSAMSKVLEHDFVFAYSTAYNEHFGIETVSDSTNDSYQLSPDISCQPAYFMSMYNRLSDKDRQIIENYMIKKIERNDDK